MINSRILVGEDKPADQPLAGTVLERDGFTGQVADAAVAAIRSVAARHQPELIWLDVQPAGRSGFMAKPIDTRTWGDQVAALLGPGPTRPEPKPSP